MLVRVHSLSLLAAIAASGVNLASAAPFESSSALAPRDMPRPRFGNVPYGVDITHCTTKGKVALTFDDGPGELTEKIVDTLEKNGNIKATFFLVGTNGNNGIANAAYTPLLKRMLDAGHQLGSHSWSHKDFNTISHEEKIQELVKNEEVFAKVLGFVPTYFRPPYTHCDGACLAALNELSYHVTDYNLDTKDWVDGGANSKATYANAINGGNPSSDSFISLAHDIHSFTANGFVQYMIDVAKEKGYQFTTIGDCLGDPKANWYRDPKSGEPWSGVKEEPKPTTTTKSAAPTSSSETKKESKTETKTETKTESATAKATPSKSASEDDNETETEKPTGATTAKPPGPSATINGGANVGLGPVTPTGTTGGAAPTGTPSVVEVNGAGRAVFSIGGVLAGAFAWAMMI
ncbi:chitin deacetylase [Colletotrichum truncatum]|uniref:Chitin deacetylase n=1 Tax=Colletotrichum truncatum TaxID=5467 RepID=A0ACC3YWZ1_COLTU|nr:chitin deacetylase [Colletotrichum truncatum]KAF6787561.1 chitin deacetylase [Colletotrichum truncatum]